MAERKRVAVVLLFGALVLLAGCGSVLGSEPSVSDPRTNVYNGTPAVVFNYSVGDYSKALLESPNGNVVGEVNLEPNKSTDGFYVMDLRPGTYKIILQQGGETVSKTRLDFEGPDVRLEGVSANWSDGTVQSVQVQLRNTGDLPAKVQNGTATLGNESAESNYLYRWVDSNSTETVNITPSFGQLSVSKGGEARGAVTLRTANQTFTGEFSKTFEGAELSITNVSDQWDGSVLTQATVTVENTGDLPADADAYFVHGEESSGFSGTERIPPGETVTFTVEGAFDSIYESSSAGNISLLAVVNSSHTSDRREITHYVEPARVSIESLSPTWQSGSLESVDFSVQNSGGASAEITAKLAVNGESLSTITETAGGGSTVNLSFKSSLLTWSYAALEGGDYTVKVSVSTGDATTTATSTKTFGGPSASVANVNADFSEQYGSDKLLLSSLSMEVQNDGDIPMKYDSVRLRIGNNTWTDSSYSATSIGSGDSKPESIFVDDDLPVSSGEHELSIEFIRDGTTVGSDTVTVTA